MRKPLTGTGPSPRLPVVPDPLRGRGPDCPWRSYRGWSAAATPRDGQEAPATDTTRGKGAGFGGLALFPSPRTDTEKGVRVVPSSRASTHVTRRIHETGPGAPGTTGEVHSRALPRPRPTPGSWTGAEGSRSGEPLTHCGGREASHDRPAPGPDEVVHQAREKRGEEGGRLRLNGPCLRVPTHRLGDTGPTPVVRLTLGSSPGTGDGLGVGGGQVPLGHPPPAGDSSFESVEEV